MAVERAYCGSYMTSLEMAGISITLLHLDDTLRKCLGMVFCIISLSFQRGVGPLHI